MSSANEDTKKINKSLAQKLHRISELETKFVNYCPILASKSVFEVMCNPESSIVIYHIKRHEKYDSNVL